MVAAAVEGHLQRVARARTDHLAVQMRTLIAVRGHQPLVRVLVIYVSGNSTAMLNSELGVIVDVAVTDVRRLVRVGFYQQSAPVGGPVNRKRHWHKHLALRIGGVSRVAEFGSSTKLRCCCRWNFQYT